MHTKAWAAEFKDSDSLTGLNSEHFISLSSQHFSSNFRTKIYSNSDLELYRNKTLDPSFRGVVFNYLPQILYLNNIHSKNFSYLIAKERLVTNWLVFYLQRGHFLTDEINSKIEMFHQSGLIVRTMSQYVDLLFLKSNTLKRPQAKLEIQQLSAVFWLWLLGLALTFLVFLCEFFWGHCRRLKHK